MTNKTKSTKQPDILKELNDILIEAYTGKNSYKNGFQKYLVTFFSNYESALSRNSKPLFDFMKKLDNVERLKINLWIKQNTSVSGVNVKSEGLTFTLKDGENSVKIYNDSINWYDMKIEVKPYQPDDTKLKKNLERLLKYYSKQAITEILSTL